MRGFLTVLICYRDNIIGYIDVQARSVADKAPTYPETKTQLLIPDVSLFLLNLQKCCRFEEIAHFTKYLYEAYTALPSLPGIAPMKTYVWYHEGHQYMSLESQSNFAWQAASVKHICYIPKIFTIHEVQK